MTTEAQVHANRLNAQKSTGPRTPEGKAKVAQNAVQHGLRAETPVLAGEDEGAYTGFRAEMLGALRPEGTVERFLAERIVNLMWRLKRAERSENAALELLCDRHIAQLATSSRAAQSPEANQGAAVGDEAMLGEILTEDFAGDRVLERMLGYERRMESSLCRMMIALRRLQKDRQSEAKAAAAREKQALTEQMRRTKPMAGDVPGGPQRAANKQSQSPAGQSEGNVSRHKELGEEEALEPWSEQSRDDDDLVPHEPAWSGRERREAGSLCLV